jgi:hypothetical protein
LRGPSSLPKLSPRTQFETVGKSRNDPSEFSSRVSGRGSRRSARGDDRFSFNDMMTFAHDFEVPGRHLTTDVALVIAVGEPCRDFSQVAPPDWLTAKRTERFGRGVLPFTKTNFTCRLQSTPFLQNHGSSSVPWPQANVLRALGTALRGLRSLALLCVDRQIRRYPVADKARSIFRSSQSFTGQPVWLKVIHRVEAQQRMMTSRISMVMASPSDGTPQER